MNRHLEMLRLFCSLVFREMYGVRLWPCTTTGTNTRSATHDARVSFFMTNSLLDLSYSNSPASGACITAL